MERMDTYTVVFTGARGSFRAVNVVAYVRVGYWFGSHTHK